MRAFTDMYGCCLTDLSGELQLTELGAMSVWAATLPPHIHEGTLESAVGSTARHYHLALLLSGDAVVSHENRETALSAGDFCWLDCSRPYELQTSLISAVGIVVPEALLPLRRGEADLTLGRRIGSRDGVGALLARFLKQVTGDTGAHKPTDGPRLAIVLGDMVAALLVGALESDRRLPTRQPHLTLTPRIERFVQQHLWDSQLTPRSIAAAHGISLSYLHRLFQDQKETVAAYIRRQRLERARFDLADPAQGTTPVHAIATRWGFSRATDFTRAFRAAYGIPPTVYRRHSHALGRRIAI
ncbi:helix-turn-helix domain-containing protein [Streptomyces sp. NK08204]|uniref:helix-turn-helix domain-containing protein n=1 Tax=Streptomyces sp. NK08204 TaxID=2873260 RepID=UPI0027E33061|nr:helix-turn-helix domain-containing protein [Streptomyces sp. NK08204]